MRQPAGEVPPPPTDGEVRAFDGGSVIEDLLNESLERFQSLEMPLGSDVGAESVRPSKGVSLPADHVPGTAVSTNGLDKQTSSENFNISNEVECTPQIYGTLFASPPSPKVSNGTDSNSDDGSLLDGCKDPIFVEGNVSPKTESDAPTGTNLTDDSSTVDGSEGPRLIDRKVTLEAKDNSSFRTGSTDGSSDPSSVYDSSRLNGSDDPTLVNRKLSQNDRDSRSSSVNGSSLLDGSEDSAISPRSEDSATSGTGPTGDSLLTGCSNDSLIGQRGILETVVEAVLGLKLPPVLNDRKVEDTTGSEAGASDTLQYLGQTSGETSESAPEIPLYDPIGDLVCADGCLTSRPARSDSETSDEGGTSTTNGRSLRPCSHPSKFDSVDILVPREPTSGTGALPVSEYEVPSKLAGGNASGVQKIASYESLIGSIGSFIYVGGESYCHQASKVYRSQNVFEKISEADTSSKNSLELEDNDNRTNEKSARNVESPSNASIPSGPDVRESDKRSSTKLGVPSMLDLRTVSESNEPVQMVGSFESLIDVFLCGDVQSPFEVPDERETSSHAPRAVALPHVRSSFHNISPFDQLDVGFFSSDAPSSSLPAEHLVEWAQSNSATPGDNKDTSNSNLVRKNDLTISDTLLSDHPPVQGTPSNDMNGEKSSLGDGRDVSAVMSEGKRSIVPSDSLIDRLASNVDARSSRSPTSDEQAPSKPEDQDAESVAKDDPPDDSVISRSESGGSFESPIEDLTSHDSPSSNELQSDSTNSVCQVNVENEESDVVNQDVLHAEPGFEEVNLLPSQALDTDGCVSSQEVEEVSTQTRRRVEKTISETSVKISETVTETSVRITETPLQSSLDSTDSALRTSVGSLDKARTSPGPQPLVFAPGDPGERTLIQHDCTATPEYTAMAKELESSRALVAELHKSVESLRNQLSVETSQAEKISLLEQRIAQQEKELQLSRQEHDLDVRTITALRKEMETKVDTLKKQYENELKGKELMVMKYAISEKERIDSKKERDQAEKRLKDQTKEVENISAKLKYATTEKSRISLQLEQKISEVTQANKEIERLKEELNSREIKIKWIQNKVKTEMDIHKECPGKIEGLMTRVQQLEEELTSAMKTVQNFEKGQEESESRKALELKLKEEHSKLILERHEHTEKETKLKSLQSKNQVLIEENNNLSLKVQRLEQERFDFEQKLTSAREDVRVYCNTVAELQGRLVSLDTLSSQLLQEREKAETTTLELERLRKSNEELMCDMASCRNKEADMLAFTQKLTTKNVQLQSEFSTVEAKAAAMERENQSAEETISNLRNRLKVVERELKGEQMRRAEECRLLARQVAERTKRSEEAEAALEDCRGEISVLRNKHAAAVRELQRELQQHKKKLDQYEMTGGGSGSDSLCHGSRTSSLGSLNEPAVTPHANNVQNHLDVPAQALVDRIVRLQHETARQKERIEFLEDHTGQLTREMQKKSRLLQNYIVREESGALTSRSMDSNKAEVTRHGGIMASVYGSRLADDTMTLELSLEINHKLQAVLEDTLLKNITLKESIDTLGDEIARLSGQKLHK